MGRARNTIPTKARQAQLQALAAKVQVACARQPEMADLRTKLLAIGGEEVVFHFAEPDSERLIHEGRLWPTTHLQQTPGIASHCHMNCLYRWNNDPERWQFTTGYALSDDGLWRQHSWLMQSGTDILVETTIARLHYYGVALDEAALRARYAEIFQTMDEMRAVVQALTKRGT